MTPFRIYLKRPPVEVLVDWVFEQQPTLRTLLLWDGATFEEFLMPSRPEGATMNYTTDYLWDWFKVEQQRLEARYRNEPSRLEFVQ